MSTDYWESLLWVLSLGTSHLLTLHWWALRATEGHCRIGRGLPKSTDKPSHWTIVGL
ncbi:protein of unknown function [Magnetospira sp. QH-2]|nr:protein of unknown function [Magnetospira sp. QH-2]